MHLIFIILIGFVAGLADHPALIKTLGGAALSNAPAHMAERHTA
jgi:hypothetical protein